MRIEEITKKRLSKVPDLELKQLQYRFTKYWDNHFKSNNKEMVGCFTRGGFISKYRMLLSELSSSKRSLECSTCAIDREAFRQTMQVKKDGFDVAVLEELIMQKCFVFIDKDFAKADEVNITIQLSEDEPNLKLEEILTEVFKEQDKEVVFTYQTDFEGTCLPLYELGLRPVKKLEELIIKKDGECEQFDEPIEIILPVVKGDEHIVYGIVYEPDTKDAQGDQATAAEIKKAAYDFMEHCQDFKVMHKGKKVKIKILENYIAPVNFSIGKRKVKKGSWVLVTRVLDKDVWKDIKAGKLTGYSMAGYAKIE